MQAPIESQLGDIVAALGKPSPAVRIQTSLAFARYCRLVMRGRQPELPKPVVKQLAPIMAKVISFA